MKLKYLIPVAAGVVVVSFGGATLAGAGRSEPPPVREEAVARTGPPQIAADESLEAQIRHEFDTGWMQIATPDPDQVGFARIDELMPSDASDGLGAGEAVRIYDENLNVVAYVLEAGPTVPADVLEAPGFDWVEWANTTEPGKRALARIEAYAGPQSGGTPTVIGDLFTG